MYRRILVPTDGSALSDKAVGDAARLAASLGAELVVLNVVPCYPTGYYEGGSNVSVAEVARIEGELALRGQALAEAARQQAEDLGVRAKAVTVCSDLVAETILAAARKHRCDLVVMASHGRKGVKRLLLGSETQNVLTQGSLPVLVLR